MRKTALERFIGYRMKNGDILNFFEKHDYVTRVMASDDGLGCTVSFPSQKMLGGEDKETICVYQIQEEPLPSGVHYYS